jgi:hypothetical protein
VIVLLKGPAEERGPRVVSIPGRPLIYQEEPVGPNNTVLALPPIPFRNDAPWFLRSAAIDFSLAGERFRSLFEQGFTPFLVYFLPLTLLLTSLFFIFKLSTWPLANLFLGFLAFRGILAAETFVNSPEIQGMFSSFLGTRIPLPFVAPLLFAVLAVLINLYSFLVFLARKRGDED